MFSLPCRTSPMNLIDLTHMKYFALAMSLIYVVAGALLIFTNFLAAEITQFRVLLGCVLLGFGSLRGYMWQNKLTQREEDQ